MLEIEYTKTIVVDAKCSLEEFLSSEDWDFYIVTGFHAETYYLAEKDDNVLVVSVEISASGYDTVEKEIFMMDAKNLDWYFSKREDIASYIKENQDLIILMKDIEDYV